MSSCFINVLFRGPRVFSENDEPQERAIPQMRAVSFQAKGKSLGPSDSSVERSVTSGMRFSSGSESVAMTTAPSVAGMGSVAAFSETITISHNDAFDGRGIS